MMAMMSALDSVILAMHPPYALSWVIVFSEWMHLNHPYSYFESYDLVQEVVSCWEILMFVSVFLHLMDSFFFENLCLGNHDVVLVTLPVCDCDVVCWEVLTFDDPGRTGCLI
jgi:hypothetical protein